MYGRNLAKGGGEGADAAYEPPPSDFERSIAKGKPSAGFEKRNPRFKDPAPAGPEVEAKHPSIADVVGNGKGTPSWEQNKPRFANPADGSVGPGDYEPPVSDFEKSINGPPQHAWVTPEKGATRGGWLTTKDAVDAPAPGEYQSKGAFDDVIKASPSSNFAATKPRFKEPEPSGPEVEAKHPTMADVIGNGKGGAAWEAAKPRFQQPPQDSVGPGDYEPPVSDFEKATIGAPQHAWVTPEKGATRGGWLTTKDAVDAPAPGQYESKGAFDEAIKASPSSNFSATKPRFKDPEPAPEGYEPPPSEFEKAVHGAGTPNFTAGSDRFKKQYNVPSYGEPGAFDSAALEREQRERKLAHQRAQAEAQAAAALAKQQNYR